MSLYQKLPQTEEITKEDEGTTNVPPVGPQAIIDKEEDCSGSDKDKLTLFGNEEHRAIFWSSKQGIYFAYKWREWKIMACRAFLKIFSILMVMLLYLAMWNVCDLCIMYTMFAACGVTLLGGNFMFSSCWIGILATLMRGFRIGSTDAHVDVKWTL